MAVTAQDIVAAFNKAGLEDQAAVVRLLREVAPLSDARREQRRLRLQARIDALTNELAVAQADLADLEG